MNTIDDLLKPIREEFDKEFPNSIYSDMTLHGLTTRWRSNDDIFSFFDKHIRRLLEESDETEKLAQDFNFIMRRLGDSWEATVHFNSLYGNIVLRLSHNGNHVKSFMGATLKRRLKQAIVFLSAPSIEKKEVSGQ